jgi:hypothetical protein
MLNSWTWWAGFVIAGLTGWRNTVSFAYIFVIVRATLTIGLPRNPVDGRELANTMARLRTRADSLRWVGAGALAATICIVSAASVINT